tara:strand:+ start:4175 stop:4504 length:330 start_codon:yes stop_codon:yes gene_type:complete
MRIMYVGTKPGNFPPERSPTIRRISKWSDAAGIVDWDWTNLSNPEHMKRIEGCKVIAMGNEVHNYFVKNNIEHLKVPHPSGLNRMWNDPELEPKVIEQIRGLHLNETMV